MKNLFKKYDLELEDHELKKFEKFLEIFIETNSQINLSAIRDTDGIIEKHFIDSLMFGAFFDIHELTEEAKEHNKTLKIADIGTGGGFPGIPLAIVYPEAEFMLIDSVAKKLRCIDDFANKLDLRNVKTLAGRAEDIGQDPKHREEYDIIVSRATAYFPTLLEYALPLLKVGGIFGAYKLTDKQEFGSIKKALHRLGGKIYKIKNYTLEGQERSIVFIEKISKTHTKYPRKVGIPLKEPIV